MSITGYWAFWIPGQPSERSCISERVELPPRPHSTPAGPLAKYHDGAKSFNAARSDSFKQAVLSSPLQASRFQEQFRSGRETAPSTQPMASLRSTSAPTGPPRTNTLASALEYGKVKQQMSRQALDKRKTLENGRIVGGCATPGFGSFQLARPQSSSKKLMQPQVKPLKKREDEVWGDVMYRQYPNTCDWNRSLEWTSRGPARKHSIGRL